MLWEKRIFFNIAHDTSSVIQVTNLHIAQTAGTFQELCSQSICTNCPVVYKSYNSSAAYELL